MVKLLGCMARPLRLLHLKSGDDDVFSKILKYENKLSALQVQSLGLNQQGTQYVEIQVVLDLGLQLGPLLSKVFLKWVTLDSYCFALVAKAIAAVVKWITWSLSRFSFLHPHHHPSSCWKSHKRTLPLIQQAVETFNALFLRFLNFWIRHHEFCRRIKN